MMVKKSVLSEGGVQTDMKEATTAVHSKVSNSVLSGPPPNGEAGMYTGWAWLIQSHLLARFCFKLSGNLN